MKKFGLIGYKLNHSKSPRLHQLIASLFNRELSYDLLDVAHINDVSSRIDDLKNGRYDGFNITIPYKEAVLPFLDRLTPKAKKIGAVNTIYIEDNLVVGDNTDYDGFKYLLEQHLSMHQPSGVLILGSGGAAKSSYAVCKDLGLDPYVVSRKPVQSSGFKNLVSYKEAMDITCDLIINATPIGMYPHSDAAPIDVGFVKDKYVIDLIYNPRITKLMDHAKHSIGGIDMLIIQAFVAQNIWFNESITIDSDILKRIKEDLNE